MFCIQHALGLLEAQGELKGAVETPATRGNEPEEAVALIEPVLKAINMIEVGALKVGADAPRLTAMRNEAVKVARDAGFLAAGVGEWALLNLLENKTIERSLGVYAPTSIKQLSLGYQSSEPTKGDLHIDPGYVVANLHLSDDYEDTGTSFWRVKPEQQQQQPTEACVGSAGASDCNKGFHDYMKAFDSLLAQRNQRGKSKGRGRGKGKGNAVNGGDDGDKLLNFLDTVDPTDTFEHMHTIPVRKNRIIVYSGHIPHSAHFPPAAAERMLAGKGKRMMLQHFVPVVSLQAWELSELRTL